jgi:hypothetical protein
MQRCNSHGHPHERLGHRQPPQRNHPGEYRQRRYGSGPFTIALASELPTITSSLSIVGGTTLAASVRISGNGSSRIIQISPQATVTLRYLTLEDGRSQQAGGALFNRGNLTIQNGTFANNVAASDNLFADSVGGAIYTELSSTLTVTNSTFSHNEAVNSFGRSFGGEIFGDDDSTLIVTNCSFLSLRISP